MLNLGKRQAMQLDDLTEEWKCRLGRKLGCLAVVWIENETVFVRVAEHAGQVLHIGQEDVEELSQR